MPDQISANRRIKILAIMCVALMAVFVLRLFYLQVIMHDKYVADARAEQEKRLIIPAERGEIYLLDDGEPVKVVMNQTVYTMFVDPEVVTKPDDVLKAIREVVGGNTVKGYAESIKKTDTRYQVVARQVSHTQAELIRERALRGVGFQAESARVYPEKSLAAQTLGFVNFEGLGQYGIEGKFDEQLQGTDGVLQSVTDVANVPLTIGDKNIDIDPQDGRDIVLTIDRSVQSYVEQALADGLKRTGADSGSAIVMDPNTGKIMAMANLPTYDPGQLTGIQNFAQVNNGVVTSPYEPGSVMKAFTMATGIDAGAVKPDSTYVNTDYITVGDRTISNASKGQTGTITFQHALNWSLNTGMVTVAQRLGDGKNINLEARKTMYDYLYNKFRLGQSTSIELAGEQGGIIPTPNIPGAANQYATMSFGQGMDLTMIQVAAGFATIINGGTYHTPTVIEGTMQSDETVQQSATKKSYPGVIKASTSEKMRQMILGSRGAYSAAQDRKGYSVGGKTGTSQTFENGKIVDGQTIATYLGFGGDTMPKYVIMVQVSGKNKNLGGGDDANPIFTDISNWMIDYKKLQPKA
ncbi:MAG: penicillin-binding protein 2 [Patescibacteria group bacterium]